MTGASQDAIQHHYDVGTAFYSLWLDPSLTYSCALFDDSPGADNSLAAAQTRKIDYHLDNCALAEGERLLDVGFGWGSTLARAFEKIPGLTGHGLTLSADQQAVASDRLPPEADLHLCDWRDYDPGTTYHGIISIGAFEHFAAPGLGAEGKIAVYRAFFEKCAGLLPPGRCLSLQTIILDRLNEETYPDFIASKIFPETMPPRVPEIFAAADGLFKIEALRNDNLHYARTCDLWVDNLVETRKDVIALAGREKLTDYLRYLKLSAHAFRENHLGLLRLRLRRHP